MDKRHLLCAVVMLLPAACDDTAYPTPGIYEPNWTGMQALMADNCEECHRAGGYGAYVQGATDHGWTAPDDLRSDVSGNFGYFVTPGDGEHSYLYLAITGKATYKADDGTDIALPLMPLETPGLEPAQIAAVKEWIDNGASLDTATP